MPVGSIDLNRPMGVAVLMFVIGKGLLARISQSADFFPTFCAFGPTPFRGPFLPGRGLNFLFEI